MSARPGPTSDSLRHAADKRPHVIIVGGGFGGIAAAQALDGADCDVLLIDAHNFHCFQPLLYQAATAALSSADIAWPIRYVLARQKNVTVLMGAVTGVDADRQVVLSSAGDFAYDWLILATGSTHSYFGHDDWEASAPSLKTISDAFAIRDRVLKAFERAEAARTEAERESHLMFAIVGGGPTGVELAGALAELADRTLPPEFRNANPAAARILLLEGGARVLPSFAEPLSEYARRRLTRMGVEVRVNAIVEAVHDASLVVSGERVEVGGAIIWAAGVRSTPAAAWVGTSADKSGRAQVRPDLSLPDRPNVFIVGDAAAAIDAEGREAPGLAPAAKQMGRHAGRTVRARIEGRNAPGAFRYRDYGSLATIGRNSAIVEMGALRLTGFPAWVVWSLAHIYFLIGLKSRFFVAASWAWSYFTSQRGARLIIEGARAERSPQEQREQASLESVEPGKPGMIAS